MCGRATYKLTWEEIVALYQLTLFQPAVNTRARYNICPTATGDTIVDHDDKRRLERMRPKRSRQSRCFGRRLCFSNITSPRQMDARVDSGLIKNRASADLRLPSTLSYSPKKLH